MNFLKYTLLSLKRFLYSVIVRFVLVLHPLHTVPTPSFFIIPTWNGMLGIPPGKSLWHVPEFIWPVEEHLDLIRDE